MRERQSVWLSSVTWVEFRRNRRIYTSCECRHTDSHTRRPIQNYMHTQLNICRLCMVNMFTLNNSKRKRAEEEIKERSLKSFGSLGSTSSTSRCEGRLKSIEYGHVWYECQPWTYLWFAERVLQCNILLFCVKELVTKTTSKRIDVHLWQPVCEDRDEVWSCDSIDVVLCTAHSVMIVYVHFSFEDSVIETEHLHPTCGL